MYRSYSFRFYFIAILIIILILFLFLRTKHHLRIFTLYLGGERDTLLRYHPRWCRCTSKENAHLLGFPIRKYQGIFNSDEYEVEIRVKNKIKLKKMKLLIYI